MNFSIGVSKLITPLKIIDKAYISLEEGIIKEISSKKPENIALKGDYLLFPALINSHDHVIGGYYPKAGKGPYLNWLPWDNDLKKAKVYEERGKTSIIDLYYTSCYRNLISGVTTVSDHVPHLLVDPMVDKMPIRLIKDFSLAHECSKFDLKWGEGIEHEYNKAVENNWPFITHINEGFDDESKRGVSLLEKLNCLSEHTVLIHGITYSNEDIEKIAQHNANHVWCPNSNYYMFNITSKVKEIMEAGVNVCIGTDSPMSGGKNILDELRFAKYLYKKIYDEEIDDKTLVEMITVNAAKAFRLSDKLGSIEEGKIADLLLIKNNGTNPYTSLVQAKLSDISLVIYNGEPVYGDENVESLFKTLKIPYKRVNIDKVEKIVKIDKNYPDLNELIGRIRNNVGYKKKLPFVPVD